MPILSPSQSSGQHLHSGLQKGQSKPLEEQEIWKVPEKVYKREELEEIEEESEGELGG